LVLYQQLVAEQGACGIVQLRGAQAAAAVVVAILLAVLVIDIECPADRVLLVKDFQEVVESDSTTTAKTHTMVVVVVVQVARD
jgi:hypothetical protein